MATEIDDGAGTADAHSVQDVAALGCDPLEPFIMHADGLVGGSHDEEGGWEVLATRWKTPYGDWVGPPFWRETAE